jgi:hypothetical protein
MKAWLVSGLALAAAVGAVVFAQDRPAPPPAAEHKLVALVRRDVDEVKNGIVQKSAWADTLGYSEARFVVSIRPAVEKGGATHLGKGAKRHYIYHTVTTGGVPGVFYRSPDSPVQDGSIYEVITIKTCESRQALSVTVTGVEAAKVEIDIDVYLVK